MERKWNFLAEQFISFHLRFFHSVDLYLLYYLCVETKSKPNKFRLMNQIIFRYFRLSFLIIRIRFLSFLSSVDVSVNWCPLTDSRRGKWSSSSLFVRFRFGQFSKQDPCSTQPFINLDLSLTGSKNSRRQTSSHPTYWFHQTKALDWWPVTAII